MQEQEQQHCLESKENNNVSLYDNKMIKQTIKNIFSALGLEIRKKIHAPLNDSVAYNSKENTDKFYSDEKLVSNYENENRISFYAEIVNDLPKAIDFEKINSIVDVSAGTGRLLKEFQNKFPNKKYLGFEFSDSALKLCKINCPNISFVKADLYKGIEQKFDFVLCVDTLEHLEHPELAISNMLKMLNAGGHLCLIVPNGRHDKFEGHIHYWSPESFKLFIEKNNCTVKYSQVWNKYVEQCVIAQPK